MMKRGKLIASAVNGYKVCQITGASNYVLVADGMSFGEFPTVEAAKARAIHLTKAQMSATTELRGWDAKQSY